MYLELSCHTLTLGATPSTTAHRKRGVMSAHSEPIHLLQLPLAPSDDPYTYIRCTSLEQLRGEAFLRYECLEPAKNRVESELHGNGNKVH